MEWANSVRADKFADFYPNGIIGIRRETALRSGISTSHGYQINSIFFAGAGVGVEFPGKGATGLLPAFLKTGRHFSYFFRTDYPLLTDRVTTGVITLSSGVKYTF